MEPVIEKQQLLQQYADKFTDEWLFECTNTELVEEQRIPQVITGDQAEGRIINGHYIVTLLGPNPGAKRLEAQKLFEERKKKAEEARNALTQAAEGLKTKTTELTGKGSKADEKTA